MERNGGRCVRQGFSVAALVLVPAAGGIPAQEPQGRELSLEQALRMAEEVSEDVTAARAAVTRSRGSRLQARSEFFPQIFGSLGYTRTLESEFSALGGDADDPPDDGQPPGPADCGRFIPDPALPLEQRVDSLESFVRCTSTEDPFAAFRNLPFGRENQYTIGLSATQTVFAGGRVLAQSRAASAGVTTAEIALRSTRAQLMLDVAEAYYDAALAQQLFAISEATLAQAETTLDQVRVAREVGEQPEFELLRAQVTRDTQRPLVIQRRATRDLSQLRLRQLLELPLDAPLDLTTALEDVEGSGAVQVAVELLEVEMDTSVASRAPVRQAEQNVRMREADVTVARAQRFPAVSLSTSWSRVAYPESGLPSAWNQFLTNWTVSASLSVPIFTGGRIRGEEMVARAGVDEARALFAETRELAALDTRTAIEQLHAAESTWQASGGTVQQAEKAYEIADVRFREGLSTQLELTDSRILLQQAQANRAQAARDLLVARLRVALLPLLPLDDGTGVDSATGPQPLVTPQQGGSRTPQSGQTTPAPGVRTGATAVQTGGRQ